MSADLGALLRRCSRIVVRQGSCISVLEADRLIAWRTLRIVTGTPCLPSLELLRVLYPETEIGKNCVAVRIGLDAPEEALAACASARVRVLSSRVEYRC